jgi:hypothetical protein
MTHPASPAAGLDDDREVAAQALVLSRFPDLQCLRCGYGQFYVRVWSDHHYRAAFGDGELAELCCGRCGMIETHALHMLRSTETGGGLPRAAAMAGLDDG